VGEKFFWGAKAPLVMDLLPTPMFVWCELDLGALLLLVAFLLVNARIAIFLLCLPQQFKAMQSTATNGAR